MMSLAALLFAPAFAPVRPSRLQPRRRSRRRRARAPAQVGVPDDAGGGLTSETPEVVEDGTCIEDEAVEECVLAKWDAGSIRGAGVVGRDRQGGHADDAVVLPQRHVQHHEQEVPERLPDAVDDDRRPLFVGVPWILMLWATGIRKAPKIPMEGWKTCSRSAPPTRSATPAP